MSEKVLAWHFIKPDRRERYDPHRPIVVGETLSCDPAQLSFCHYGLHASTKPLDALSFLGWSDAIICRVELCGKILTGDDKLVAENRKVLWMAPADAVLHEFACWCAEQTLYLFERDYPNDKRPRIAIEAKRKFLRGEIGTEGLAAAGDAARAAAWDAAGDAARAAARDAAGAAAWDAAWDAARDAARDAQNKQLETVLLSLSPEASK